MVRWTTLRSGLALAAGAVLLAAAGSASAKDEAAAAAPPAGSPLARIHEGMSEADVVEALGRPDERTTYRTGKSHIPFYYGSDRRRLLLQYRGLGKVILSRGSFRGYRVIRVEYDPQELGGPARTKDGARTRPPTVVVPPHPPHPPAPPRP